VEHLVLNIKGKGSRKSLYIHFLGICAYGFNKELVTLFIREANEFVFY
jgi:hypothetical protein